MCVARLRSRASRRPLRADGPDTDRAAVQGPASAVRDDSRPRRVQRVAYAQEESLPLATPMPFRSIEENDRPTARRLGRPSTPLRRSNKFRAAASGLSEIRGLGAREACPNFERLAGFSAASRRRYPIEGYRERCATKDAARHALRHASDRTTIPITVAEHELRRAVRRGSRPHWGAPQPKWAHTTTTGDGGSHDHRGADSVENLVYQ